jgi:formiminoglutamase
MEVLKLYKKEQVLGITRRRTGEQKLGEGVTFIEENEWQGALTTKACRFVIVGIPEDIGVRANYGRAGAGTAFRPALDSFLNQQNNQFISARDILVLGEVLVEDLMHEAAAMDPKQNDYIFSLRQLVSQLDQRVSAVIHDIVKAGKIPIVIGGGHNNAYGNLKGASQALGQGINAINCDPHLDFRPLEGRHSGNGFSYAFEEGFLKKYAVFGMHEQYNNSASLKRFEENGALLHYCTYESMFVREESESRAALKESLDFVSSDLCGLELDLDAITNVPSSAKTSSGISPLQARQFVHQCASRLKPVYFHIAEGAPVLSHIKADNKTGKLIAYLITDFIKGYGRKS